MDKPGAHELTQLLEAWSDGEEEALEKLAPLVHDELIGSLSGPPALW